TISGTAEDDRKIDVVKINVFRKNPAPKKVWHGDHWDTDGTDFNSGNNEQYGEAYWRSCEFVEGVGVTSGTVIYPLSPDTIPDWEHGSEYELILKAYDMAGNYEVILDTISFIYDVYQPPPSEAPNTIIAFPGDDYHTNDTSTLATLSGTGTDNPPVGKVQTVKILLLQFQVGATYYWNGVTWASITEIPDPNNWPEAIATNPPFDSPNEPWYYAADIKGVNWTPNLVYNLITETRDKAGNYEKERSTNTFVYETTIPTATITYPVNNGYISQIGKIQGTCADSYPGKIDNVSFIKVRIKDLAYSTTYYVSPSWVDTTPENAWNNVSYLSPGGTWWILNDTPWTSGKTYEINVKCRDKAGNWQILYSTVTNIKADFDAPTAVITLPAEGSAYDVALFTQITGTASDAPPGELQVVKLYIKCIETDPARATIDGHDIRNHYWTLSSGQSGTAADWKTESELGYVPWLDAADVSWWYDASKVKWAAALDPGTRYQIQCYAIDRASNTSTVQPPDPGRQFYLVSPLPQTNITYPAFNAYYKSPSAMTIQGNTNDYTTNVSIRLSSAPGYSTYWRQLTTSSGEWVTSEYFNPCSPPIGNFDDVANLFSITITTDAFTDGVRYLVQSRGQGPAGEETAIEDVYFYIDRTPPTGNIITPTAFDHYTGYGGGKEIATIQGNSQDTSPGVIDSVEVQIRKFNPPDEPPGNYYYTGAKWVTEDTWLTATADDPPFDSNNENWTYQVTYGSECWKDQMIHYIRARVKDKSLPGGNVYTTSEMEVVIDRTVPTSGLSFPNKDKHNSIPIVSGTAADTSPGIWQEVNIKIKREGATETRFWTGPPSNLWSLTEQFASTSPFTFYQSSWTYENVNWQSGFKYTIITYARDRAGNSESATERLTFVYDTKKPESIVAFSPAPEGVKVNSLSVISGTADDYADSAEANYKTEVSTFEAAGGFNDGMQIALRRVSDGIYYGKAAPIGWNKTSPEWIPVH
ncbi:MAG: hypothetical protein QME68_06210, partial [Elusimicrobiota bacterium]|nr:hypothetical protein [Elusimicrobiota bacterium]